MTKQRRRVRDELLLVLGVSLGYSAVYPIVDLAGIFFGIVPALLALHLLGRDGRLGALGLQARRFASDLRAGVALAAVVGIPGLGFYFLSKALGINTNVIPEALPLLWWTVPALLLSAVQNAVLEEVVVVGYLVERLRDLSWTVPAIVAASALLRGSYHLYQGFGGFLGNAAMGLLFALFFIRYKRVTPLVIAHAVLDTCAFVGYALLRGHWAPVG